MRCPITALAVVAVCSTLLGCAGADKGALASQQGTEGIRPPKAQAYVCEGCGYRFGVPFDLPVRQQVFPPIVCPKCGRREAVRAYLYLPRDGGQAVLYRYEKYREDQILWMTEYRDTTPEERLMLEPPEVALAAEGEAQLTRYADSDAWFSPTERPEKLRPFADMMGRFKSPIPVFPADWPVVSRKKLRQR